MPRKIRLCAQNEVTEGAAKRFTVDDRDFCAVKLNGTVHVLEDRCGHMNGPISQGKLEGTVVTCPNHNAQFDLITGNAVRPPVMGGPPPAAQAPAQSQAPAQGQTATATAAPPAGGLAPSERARLMAMVRTYPLKRFTVENQDGQIYIEV